MVGLDGGRGIDLGKAERDGGRTRGGDREGDGRRANGRGERRGVRWKNLRDGEWDTLLRW